MTAFNASEAARLSAELAKAAPGIAWETARNLALSASQQLAGACEMDAECDYLNASLNEARAENDRLAARVAELEAANQRLLERRDEQMHLWHATRSQLASVKRARDEACDGWEDLWRSDNNDEPPAKIAELRRVGGSDE